MKNPQAPNQNITILQLTVVSWRRSQASRDLLVPSAGRAAFRATVFIRPYCSQFAQSPILCLRPAPCHVEKNYEAAELRSC